MESGAVLYLANADLTFSISASYLSPMNEFQLYLKLQDAIANAPEIVPCQDTDPDLWFMEKEEGVSQPRVAKEYCRGCPAIKECADYAIAANESYGIWGGLTPRERSQMRGAKQRLELRRRGIYVEGRGRLPSVTDPVT
jgi:WhiB family redox-sensing transcriptional regulator